MLPPIHDLPYRHPAGRCGDHRLLLPRRRRPRPGPLPAPVLGLAAALAVSLTAAAMPRAAADPQEPLPLEGGTEGLAMTVDSGSWMSVSPLPDDSGLVFDLLILEASPPRRHPQQRGDRACGQERTGLRRRNPGRAVARAAAAGAFLVVGREGPALRAVMPVVGSDSESDPGEPHRTTGTSCRGYLQLVWHQVGQIDIVSHCGHRSFTQPPRKRQVHPV